MLITLTGKPGTGKTLTLTSLAYKKFRLDNPRFKVWFIEKIRRKKWIYTIRQYTDYPVIFLPKKNNKIYYYYDELGNVQQCEQLSSLQFRIFDLVLGNKFIEGASFFIDEIQAKYDSMEYKDFPDSIAHYCQAHRHFDNDIYCSSQSQSRIIKRLLVLSEEYWDIQSFRKIFGFAVVNIRRSWDMKANLENGLMSDNIVDVDYFKKIYRIKKVGSLYDSKYMRYLLEDSKPYISRMYDSLQMSKEQLLNSFFPSKDEREKIKNMRY